MAAPDRFIGDIKAFIYLPPNKTTLARDIQSKRTRDSLIHVRALSGFYGVCACRTNTECEREEYSHMGLSIYFNKSPGEENKTIIACIARTPREHEALTARNMVSNHTDMQDKYCGDGYDFYRIQRE